MIQDIQNLMDTYYSWLKDKTILRQIDQWVEITTPYLDRQEKNKKEKKDITS